jgi:ABC-2 type transport system ATP-binding protein
MAQPILEAHGLDKQYGTLTAVDEVSFHIEEGEIFGLYGPTGAGKSTITALLTGMLSPDKGTINIIGCDAVHEAEKVKHLIGIVPQELSLYPTLNARENLRFFGEMYQLSGARLHERIEDVLQFVSMMERAGDPVRSLAEGMKRRLNFAVGLINRPRILFLDEPIIGADPQSRNLILESVSKLNQEQGISIFYTTKDPEEARRLCHRVAIIDQGKIIAADTPDHLIASLGGGIILAHLLQRGSAGPDEVCRSHQRIGPGTQCLYP